MFDEASGISDKVWNVAEGALTDEDTEIVWLAAGNPTQPTGRFFECFHRQRDRWCGRQIDARTVEGTNKRAVCEWAAYMARIATSSVSVSAGSSPALDRCNSLGGT